MQLDVYDYLGERALLNDAARAATVTSTTKMKLLYISKTLFEEALGRSRRSSTSTAASARSRRSARTSSAPRASPR